MSGHMVSVEYQGIRHFYMANIADPEQARAEVIRMSGIKQADVLAPLEDVTLDHFDVRPAHASPFVVRENQDKSECG